MLGGRELVTVGLSHRTAPVAVRERLAISDDRVGEHLNALTRHGLSEESVILSTCNRVEVYALVDPDDMGRGITNYLARAHGVPHKTLAPHLYELSGAASVGHLFRVAASLDSLVVGEPQILGQVKDAFRLADRHRSVGRYLRPLMRRALSVAKRVRTETRIGREPVSVGRAGVELATQVFGDLEGRRALLLGAGEISRLVCQSMIAHGLQELIVANRTYAKAVELAESFGGTAAHLDQAAHYLAEVDVVIASTGSRDHLLTREAMASIMRARRYRPLFLVDLSVPRNIDPRVHDLEGAYLFNIDDLTEVATRGMMRREAQATVAERIIEDEARRCYQSLGSRSADPLIAALTHHAEQIRQLEFERSAATLEALEPGQREVVDAMTRAMFKRVLHNSITSARRMGAEGDDEGLRLLAESFGVHPEECGDE